MVIHRPDGRHVTGSKRWRLSCGMKVGGEVVSRLEEKCCGQRMRPGGARQVLLSVSLEAFGLCRCVWFVCVCGRVEGVRLLPRVAVRSMPRSDASVESCSEATQPGANNNSNGSVGAQCGAPQRPRESNLSWVQDARTCPRCFWCGMRGQVCQHLCPLAVSTVR